MPAPTRFSILVAAALAVATPLVAGGMVWGYADEDRRHGLVFWLLFWPSELIALLPSRAADVFTQTALWTVLLYFGGYLLVWQLARSLWRRIR